MEVRVRVTFLFQLGTGGSVGFKFPKAVELDPLSSALKSLPTLWIPEVFVGRRFHSHFIYADIPPMTLTHGDHENVFADFDPPPSHIIRMPSGNACLGLGCV